MCRRSIDQLSGVGARRQAPVHQRWTKITSLTRFSLLTSTEVRDAEARSKTDGPPQGRRAHRPDRALAGARPAASRPTGTLSIVHHQLVGALF
jgi:hypothetical protein